VQENETTRDQKKKKKKNYKRKNIAIQTTKMSNNVSVKSKQKKINKDKRNEKKKN